jgi:hypothetical protein
MKKLLLLAAMAALALGASADGYKIEKVWENNSIPEIVPGNCRQGLGMNGKFYINDRTTSTISIYDENGLVGTMDGSPNCTIGRDEAGNLVLSMTTFPNNWGIGSIVKVVDPETGDYKEYEIPEECGELGRCDVLGVAQGNLMEDGVLYLTTNTSGTTIVKLVISGGEVSTDESYAPDCGNVTTSTTTPIYYYTDLEGNDVLLYNTRNANPVKLYADGDNYSPSVFMLPSRGTAMGMFPFIWDGKELFLYNLQGAANYLDGVAVAEAYTNAGNITEPIVTVAPTVTAAANANQINWLWAEPDADGVTIYQYYPGEVGGHMTVYRMTKEDPVPEIPNVWILGEVNDKDWAPNDGVLMDYDAENEVYVANVYFDGRGQSGENYFSFTTELAMYDDQGSWDYILPYRFGAYSEDYLDFWYDDMYDGQPLTLTYESPQAFRIMSGDYELVLDKNAMTLTIHRWELGDVNHSKGVDIEDVTILINRVLGNPAEVFYPNQANCTLDETGSIDIEDVTALITRVLNGSW